MESKFCSSQDRTGFIFNLDVLGFAYNFNSTTMNESDLYKL